MRRPLLCGIMLASLVGLTVDAHLPAEGPGGHVGAGRLRAVLRGGMNEPPSSMHRSVLEETPANALPGKTAGPRGPLVEKIRLCDDRRPQPELLPSSKSFDEKVYEHVACAAFGMLFEAFLATGCADVPGKSNSGASDQGTSPAKRRRSSCRDVPSEPVRWVLHFIERGGDACPELAVRKLAGGLEQKWKNGSGGCAWRRIEEDDADQASGRGAGNMSSRVYGPFASKDMLCNVVSVLQRLFVLRCQECARPNNAAPSATTSGVLRWRGRHQHCMSAALAEAACKEAAIRCGKKCGYLAPCCSTDTSEHRSVSIEEALRAAQDVSPYSMDSAKRKTSSGIDGGPASSSAAILPQPWAASNDAGETDVFAQRQDGVERDVMVWAGGDQARSRGASKTAETGVNAGSVQLGCEDQVRNLVAALGDGLHRASMIVDGLEDLVRALNMTHIPRRIEVWFLRVHVGGIVHVVSCPPFFAFSPCHSCCALSRHLAFRCCILIPPSSLVEVLL